MRIYLTGALAIEGRDRLIDETGLPSRQARLLLACLACERSRAVSKDELAAVVWPEERPGAWEASLKALVSKLRQFLQPVAEGAPVIIGQFGCYRLSLPQDTWVDWEEARRCLDQAEGAVRRRDFRAGWAPAGVAASISRRGFLHGESGAWAAGRRRALGELLARSLGCYATICMETGQAELAVQVAEEAIAGEPFRESGYQRLMRGHEMLGNRAEAIRTYHRCRELLAAELGVSPSAETEQLYLAILKED